MRNRLKHLKRVLQGTTEDVRRDIRDIGYRVELPRARGTIILTVSGVPYALVLMDDPKRHHYHHIQLAHHYGYDSLFHTTNSM
jgi:hypothetical protein